MSKQTRSKPTNIFFFKFYRTLTLIVVGGIYSAANAASSYIDDVYTKSPCLSVAQWGLASPEILWPEKLQLIIEPSDIKKWLINTSKAYLSDGETIDDRFKKTVRATLQWYVAEAICQDKVNMRFTGEYRDHLRYFGFDKFPETSMAITLEHGHINHRRKFKLFLPETRDGDIEILTTLTMQAFGFLSPFTKKIKVDMGAGPLTYLLQESPTKEFLEQNQRRESIILEGDERWLMDMLRYRKQEQGALQTYKLFAWPDNGSWASTPTSQAITWEALSLINPFFYEHFKVAAQHNLSGAELWLMFEAHHATKNLILNDALFVYLQTLLGGEHGLAINNRKFYYDPLEKHFLPIYYDGPHALYNDDDRHYEFAPESFSEDVYAKVLQVFSDQQEIEHLKLSFYRQGGEFSKDSLDKYFEKILVLVNEHKQKAKQHKKYQFENTIDLDIMLKVNSKYDFYALDTKQDRPIYCSYLSTKSEHQNNCRGLQAKEQKKLFKSPQNKSNQPVPLLGKVSMNKNLVTIERPQKHFIELNNPLPTKIIVPAGATYKLNFEANQDFTSPPSYDIHIYSSKKGIGRLFVSGAVPKQSHFKVIVHEESVNTNAERFSQELLTGCVTFIDALLKDVEISVKHATCEDGVNFVRAQGTINNIVVQNSLSDAIDADFSNLTIKELSVRDAKNDCLDLSSGNYSINKMTLSQCQDKGMSVGEQAHVGVDDMTVALSAIGIAVKDSSVVTVNQADISAKHVCAAAYRKKQEFDGASLEIKQAKLHQCSEKTYVQKGSMLKIGYAQ